MRLSTRKVCLEFLPRVCDTCISFPNAATLKNDDAEDSGEEGEDNEAIVQESKALKMGAAKQIAAEKQPTGRVVGVIKRNWRA